MRLAVIGNSHIGSLKRAWDRISEEYASVEIVFFGAKGGGLGHLKVRGRRIVPTDKKVLNSIKFISRGHTGFDPTKHDVVLIYGVQGQPFFFPLENFYSAQCIRRVMEDLVRGRLHFRLATMIRRLSDIPVYIGHRPLSAEERISENQNLDSYTKGMALLNETMFAPMNVHMISQPAETIVNGNATDLKYTIGSRRLAVGNAIDDDPHPEEDVNHMNDEFGELWLRKFFAELGVERTEE
ncbi:hypothetical protein [Parvibaculum sp.]|uniref:hypothetical protein n=1 Tax=Parvibaculum sp. TaxID=2024848 RepID=UPI003296D4CA